MTHQDFDIKELGVQDIQSPIKPLLHPDGVADSFIKGNERILLDDSLEHFNYCRSSGESPLSFEKAGPHKHLFFDPSKTKAAIVTCGGLCPGLNNVIRSAPANANDSKFCSLLAQNAVHAAMAGKTDFVIGHWRNSFTLLPIPLAVSKRKKIDMKGELWWNVLETTGQPVSINNRA